MRAVRVLVVFGAYHEAVKLCPLIKALENDERTEGLCCVAAQSRERLSPIFSLFDVTVDFELDIFKKGQEHSETISKALPELAAVLEKAKPDIILVHGDSDISLAAAMSAFYKKIPIGHIEAGVRTFNKYSPFPSEMNRVMISRLAELHFAPTGLCKTNLIRENILENIYITGNTGLDSLKLTLEGESHSFENQTLQKIDFAKGRTILASPHHPENGGTKGLGGFFAAVKKIISEFDDVRVVYPLPRVTAVSSQIKKALGKQARIHLLDPLSLTDMHRLIQKSLFVMTDSAALQEEAPSLGKPVLVIKSLTDRSEGVEAGFAFLTGTGEEEIFSAASGLLTDEKAISAASALANKQSPYGDGKASPRIVNIIASWFETAPIL